MRPLHWAVLAVGMAAQPAIADPSACLKSLEIDQPSAASGRLVTAGDLLTLRDIGPTQAVDSAPILGLSPEGDRIAFQISRADPASNSYCQGIFMLDVAGVSTRPKRLDVGGDPIIVGRAVSGFDVYTPGGVPSVVTPRWSPDEKWVAYLRRDAGKTRLWLAASDGSGARAAADLAYDIEDFSWEPGGETLLISGRPGVIEAWGALADEAKSGYLLDDRSVPVVGSEPLTRSQSKIVVSRVDARSGMVSSTSLTSVVSSSSTVPALAPIARLPLLASSGALAWIEATDPSSVTSSSRLQRRRPDGKNETCGPDLCDHIIDKWWSADGVTLYFLRRQGWANSQTSLYRWPAAARRPLEVFTTDDLLAGCVMARDALVCARETSTQPRRIVSINVATGATKPLFDPNPDFSEVRLGRVERLKWTNDLGFETFGDLVLPPDYIEGTKLPLVVVQYRARGLARGGIGDEYPILLFAAHGMAVLNFESPENVGIRQKAKTWDEVNRLDRVNWANRRSILSSLDRGVDLAVARGFVDPTRVGLTGLSDGASTVQFALVNEHRFAAAAMSTCCDEPGIVSVLDGPATGQWLKAMGFPTFTAPDPGFWAGMSLAQNARAVNTPLLLNLADREYLGALEALTALREYGKTVEAYVFPDEYHVKWQPEHRLAIYNRNLDWFSYWLKGEEDADPRKRPLYARWHALTATQSPNDNASPGK